MDRETATPEELPPLDLRKLRDLDTEEPSRAGPPRVPVRRERGGSKGRLRLRHWRRRDASGVFRLSSPEPGRWVRVLRGDLPDDDGERSGKKPDLEALTVLPPFEGHPYGALLGLGSGSAPERDRGFVCRLDGDESVRWEAMAALRDRLTPELLPVIEPLLEDNDEYIRRLALEYYAELT